VYIKDSKEDAVCSYCENDSYAVTGVLLSSNNKDKDDVPEGELAWNEGLFNTMIGDLKKQVYKCES
jgi:hypothetical protein